MSFQVNRSGQILLSDSANEIKLLPPSGYIIWGDFLWKSEHPERSGAAGHIEDTRHCGSVFSKEGTRLAILTEGTVEFSS